MKINGKPLKDFKEYVKQEAERCVVEQKNLYFSYSIDSEADTPEEFFVKKFKGKASKVALPIFKKAMKDNGIVFYPKKCTENKEMFFKKIEKE